MFSDAIWTVDFFCWLRDVCVLSFMSPSLVKICPCDAHQWVNMGWSPSFWIRCRPLWPQAGSLNLSLPQFLYYKGHTDLPHRDVVRINKCWYSALETWRCCVNAKSEQLQGRKLYSAPHIHQLNLFVLKWPFGGKGWYILWPLSFSLSFFSFVSSYIFRVLVEVWVDWKQQGRSVA